MSGQATVIVGKRAHVEIGRQTAAADGLVQGALPGTMIVEHGRSEHIAGDTANRVQVNMHAFLFSLFEKESDPMFLCPRP